MKSLKFPHNGGIEEIEVNNNVVIIGANGSGKSHLGAKIEILNENSQRISAQRVLVIPNAVNVKSEEASYRKIKFGNEEKRYENKIHKWGTTKDNEQTIRLINDYDSVLSAIFARDYRETREFKSKYDSGAIQCGQIKTIVDNILDVWNDVFPQRTIIFDDFSISAQIPNEDSKYHAKFMSDGERVAIYLIGQILIAPDDTIIIVDEPEIHLHKSVMNKLWNKIEEYCPNKVIVYITHDLDFAASRNDAKKIWVKSYNGSSNWDLEILDSNDDIPEDLFIEILGNRKKTLFVEGQKGSLDIQIYSAIYDDYYVVPCHNCAKVIELTKAFNNNAIIKNHNLEVIGLIDRDFMTDIEIASYQQNNIHTLDVAEVENLFLVEGIQRVVLSYLLHQQPEQVIADVKTYIFQKFTTEEDAHIASICEREIKHKLNCYNKDLNTIESLRDKLNELIRSIDIDSIYNSTRTKIDSVIASNDLDQLLKIYNRKTLLKQICGKFGLVNDGYSDLVLKLIKSNNKQPIIDELKKYVPAL